MHLLEEKIVNENQNDTNITIRPQSCIINNNVMHVVQKRCMLHRNDACCTETMCNDACCTETMHVAQKRCMLHRNDACCTETMHVAQKRCMLCRNACMYFGRCENCRKKSKFRAELSFMKIKKKYVLWLL